RTWCTSRSGCGTWCPGSSCGSGRRGGGPRWATRPGAGSREGERGGEGILLRDRDAGVPALAGAVVRRLCSGFSFQAIDPARAFAEDRAAAAVRVLVAPDGLEGVEVGIGVADPVEDGVDIEAVEAEERLRIEGGALRVADLVGRPAGAPPRGGRLAAALDSAAGGGGRQVGRCGVVGGGPGVQVLGEARRASDRLAVRHRLGLRAVPGVRGCKTRAGQRVGRSIAMRRERVLTNGGELGRGARGSSAARPGWTGSWSRSPRSRRRSFPKQVCTGGRRS